MKEQKDPLEEHRDSGVEEEYSFLQEVIKDEAGSRNKIQKDILRMIGLGFIFGIVACFSFFAFKPWIERQMAGNPEQITIPKDEEEQPGDGVDVQDEPKVVLDADSYRQMLQSLQSVAREVNKSLVEINGITGDEDWTKELENKKNSVSGVLVADNGQELLILGQISPVKDAKSIKVTFADRKTYDGTVKSQDAALGLCVYAVPKRNLTSATWAKIDIAVLGSSNSVIGGDTAIVLGKPFGYGDAVGYGIVASSKNYLETTDGKYQLIHTDVAGSSAGSGIITNIRGEVIGIIDQRVLEEDSRNMIAGYGISDIKDVIELLSNGKNVPYLGVYGLGVTEEMEAQGLPQGVYVREVEVDSPAMAAGIQTGDILTSIEEDEITSLTGYRNLLIKQSEGNEITLKGKRQGTGGEYVDIEFSVTIRSKE